MTLEELKEDTSAAQFNAVVKAKANLLTFLSPYKHDKNRAIWIYGPPKTGKTTYALDCYPNAYLKDPSNLFWEGYTG